MHHTVHSLVGHKAREPCPDLWIGTVAKTDRSDAAKRSVPPPVQKTGIRQGKRLSTPVVRENIGSLTAQIEKRNMLWIRSKTGVFPR